MSEHHIGAPGADEYAPYYGYMVEGVAGRDVMAVLRAQPAETAALLGGLSEEEAGYRYAPGKWSVKEVLGHVIDTERVFAYRALAFARGEAQAQPGFEQDDYVREGGFDDRSIGSLVAEYEAVRGATVAFFEGLDRAAWTRAGTANQVGFTVRAIAHIIAGHQAHHMAALREKYLGGGRS